MSTSRELFLSPDQCYGRHTFPSSHNGTEIGVRMGKLRACVCIGTELTQLLCDGLTGDESLELPPLAHNGSLLHSWWSRYMRALSCFTRRERGARSMQSTHCIMCDFVACQSKSSRAHITVDFGFGFPFPCHTRTQATLPTPALDVEIPTTGRQADLPRCKKRRVRKTVRSAPS